MSVDDEGRLHPWMERILRARIGHAPKPWPQALHRALDRLTRQAHGLEPEVVLRRLCETWDPPAVDALVSAATVTHTSFFRHPTQLERLRLELSARGRPARIWCAGCATGEEAYSIALVAREAGAEVSIVATDVNRDALATARRGSYPAAALRRGGVYAPGETWTAPAELCASIRFEEASLIGPSPSAGEGPFDFIFCRNVLIYFEAEAGMAVLETLAGLLAPTGALVVAPVDALRRLPKGLHRAEPLGWLDHRPSNVSLAPTSAPKRTSFPPAASAPDASDGLLARAARALGARAFEEAEGALRSALALSPDRPDAWFLLGEVLMQRGEPTQARTAFAQAERHASSDPEGRTLAAAARRRARSDA